MNNHAGVLTEKTKEPFENRFAKSAGEHFPQKRSAGIAEYLVVVFFSSKNVYKVEQVGGSIA